MDGKSEEPSSAKTNPSLHKRYNRMVVIDLKKRAILRNLVKQNTFCEHKQVYTHANAICRRMSSSYEEGRISAQQAADLMIQAHDQMSHRGLPKDVVAAEMNKRLNKLEGVGQNGSFEVTMANVSYANNIIDNQDANRKPSDDQELDKYSESYWAEVI
ncbi:MAG TPA: hypothetical protein VJ729_18070 [Nitrososphaeraceae archaeon]|nr:hypothetical protein [Nitrososphaeraceae archaeon]